MSVINRNLRRLYGHRSVDKDIISQMYFSSLMPMREEVSFSEARV